MKERPILFNTEMVRAILDGRKTQERRVVGIKPGDYFNTNRIQVGEMSPGYGFCSEEYEYICPFGSVGDILWVRESWITHKIHDKTKPSKLMDENYLQAGISYAADLYNGQKSTWMGKTRPSRFMPRRFSRIFLRINDIRVERVQDITGIDAMAEGINDKEGMPKYVFQRLWDSINEKRGYGWEVNPWVWALTFEPWEVE